MADYTLWDINDYLPGQPLTSAKAISFHENLNAVCEGAAGAPRILPEALNLGVKTFNASGSNSATASINDFLPSDYISVTCGAEASAIGTSGGNLDVSIRASNDNGATWGAGVAFVADSITASGSRRYSFTFDIVRSTGGVYGVASVGGSAGVIESFGVSNVNALEFSVTGSGSNQIRGIAKMYGGTA